MKHHPPPRLAIEDARAKPLIDWRFIDALKQAERRLEVHDELVDALLDCAAALSPSRNGEERDALRKACVVLTKLNQQ